MNKKKLIIIIVLSIFCIGILMGSASATKYKARCHSDGVGKYSHPHKATWNKKSAGYSYVDTIYKKGHFYKKYVKLYKLSCVCYNKAHLKQMKIWDSKLPYSYYTITATYHPKYKYKIII